MDQNKLREYARLVVRVGVNVQPGQPVIVNCPVERADFGRLLLHESYEAGASNVYMLWGDDYCSREHWLRAEEAAFDAVEPWNALQLNSLAEKGAARIAVHASDPENLKGVDADRLQRYNKAVGRDLEPFYRLMMANGIPWCVVSVPIPSWAKTVFPALSEAEAMEKLWEEIFASVRISGDGSAVKRWEEHCRDLEEKCAGLNALKLRRLHYTNALGTDLTVEMPENHVWMGGGDVCRSGVRFVANMPTEEIFSAPRRDGVNGTLVASKPLVLNGNLIEGIRFELRDGRIVGIHADRNEELLRKAVDTDEGSHYLGEIALVPYHSPISDSGILFYNTLFDENASCHFAFGEAYPACIQGGDELETEELIRRGINAKSDMHEDFMVGTADLSITGETEDGRIVTIFRDGDFAL